MNTVRNKTLTQKQFNILVTLAEEPQTYRELLKKTLYSLGSISTTMRELKDLGYVENGVITKKGIKALEPYRVKRAIFMAAGFGSRLIPVTIKTPKPLVKVHDRRIIDTQIDACLAAGIKEIYIVRGYLKEQFNELLKKYPMIKFIDNDDYNEANNIYSVLLAKEHLENAYVFEADLLILNPNIITKYHYQSDFLGIWKLRTDDWCFTVSPRRNIIRQKVGGINCYQMVGISYWNKEDAKKLQKDLPEAFDLPGGKFKFWEQVPLDVFKMNYQVKIRDCRQEDVVEIDTFSELKTIDRSYINYKE